MDVKLQERIRTAATTLSVDPDNLTPNRLKAIKAVLAIDDIKVTASDIREALLVSAHKSQESAGNASRKMRQPSTGRSPAQGASSVVAVRAGSDVFDAPAALARAIASATRGDRRLQFSEPMTRPQYIGGRTERWVPSEAQLETFDRRLLKDLLPGALPNGASALTYVYWPRTSAERAPFTNIFLVDLAYGEPRYLKLQLRPPAPVLSKAEMPQTAAQIVALLLRRVGFTDATCIDRNRGPTPEVEVFFDRQHMGQRVPAMVDALLANGFTEKKIDDPYTGYQKVAFAREPDKTVVFFTASDSVGVA